MEVLVIASGRFALPLLAALRRSRHKLLAVASQPDRPKGRGLRPGPTPVSEYCLREGLQLYRPEDANDPDFVRHVRALAPGALIAASYGQRLSDELLALPRFAPLNVHASLLPRHRGAAPVARAILVGDAETGVTICRMVRRLDAGPIFGQRRVAIGPDETTPDLEARLAEAAVPMLLEVLDGLEAGTATQRPQDESQATLAPKIRKEEARIDWRFDARQIHNHVRALQPQPRAWFFYRRRRVQVLCVRPEPGMGDGPPGTVLAACQEFRVRCRDGAVQLVEVQPEGGRRMSAAEFLRGHPVALREVLE